jgi:hypothetical protein
LPVVRIFRPVPPPFAETEATDPYSAGLYHDAPAEHFARLTARGYAVSAEARPHYVKKIVRYYASNLHLLHGLARAFNFDALVVFQPNGLLYEKNAFVRDPTIYKNSALYATLDALHRAVRAKIAAKELEMLDLSELHDRAGAPYVDAVHYSAELSKIFAAELHAREKMLGSPE